ncbi:hypothetical protein A2U01_0113703, partial [Trifolium medium]|nr:hypothetical protein [Trifolium medium]
MSEGEPLQAQSSSSRRTVDYSWVADEPRYTVSEYADC